VAHRKEKGTAISGMVAARKTPPMPHVTSTRLSVSFAEPIKSRFEAVQLTCRPAKRMSADRGLNGLSANDALGQFMTPIRTLIAAGTKALWKLQD
jgi:hypothetical protein